MAIRKEIENALRACKNWQVEPTNIPEDPSARAFKGSANNWSFLVVSFDISPQGFPKGARGYDGTAVRSILGGRTIIRMPRKLAEMAFKSAEQFKGSLNGLPIDKIRYMQPPPRARFACERGDCETGDVDDRAVMRLAALRAQGIAARIVVRNGTLVIKLPDGTIEEV